MVEDPTLRFYQSSVKSKPISTNHNRVYLLVLNYSPLKAVIVVIASSAQPEFGIAHPNIRINHNKI